LEGAESRLIYKEKIVKPFFKTEVNAYNLYSVSRHRQHYLQCLPEPEETLGERVAAAAAFLACIALLIIITG
jgi:hypothetical protein